MDYINKLPTSTVPTTTDGAMDPGYPGFPLSIIVTGFFVTSLAYLVCFCCCLIQFFIRRNRQMRQNENSAPSNGQKNDTLKRRFLNQFRNSLRRLQRSTSSNTQELQMVRRMSTSSCPICFDDYTGDPAEILMGKIKSCGHFYHFECIWTWLEARGNCPLCREKVALTEEDIQALALRHMLSDLEKNAQDHALVNMTDTSGKDSEEKPQHTLEGVSVQTEPSVLPTSTGGIVNDGFEDIPLEDDSSSYSATSSLKSNDRDTDSSAYDNKLFKKGDVRAADETPESRPPSGTQQEDSKIQVVVESPQPTHVLT